MPSKDQFSNLSIKLLSKLFMSSGIECLIHFLAYSKCVLTMGEHTVGGEGVRITFENIGLLSGDKVIGLLSGDEDTGLLSGDEEDLPIISLIISSLEISSVVADSLSEETSLFSKSLSDKLSSLVSKSVSEELSHCCTLLILFLGLKIFVVANSFEFLLVEASSNH